MKVSTAKYLVKEGFINIFRNMLMTLASVTIIAATLLVIGFFMIILLNVQKNTEILKKTPLIQVFCVSELTEEDVQKVEEQIKLNNKITNCQKVDKEEAFRRVKQLFKGHEDIFDGLDSSFLPVSFEIKIKNYEETEAVVEQLRKISGVKDVKYSKETIDFISKAAKIANSVIAVFAIILFLISLSIISNTIKLTVFARRKEIGIMKYIGATDWFIKWPFIIEGIIIGLIGAAVSSVIVIACYKMILGWMEGLLGSDFQLVGLSELVNILLIVYFMTGIIMGVVGSIISVRKHLNV